MTNATHKMVRMQLVGEDGNAFAILGRFQRAAKQQGWTQEEIKSVMDRATSGDYRNLLGTIQGYVDEGDGEDE